MRLKKIEPGMVIHCKTQEEKKNLLEELEKQGYTWPGGKKPTDTSNLAFSSIHVNTNGCNYILWSGESGNVEFSDLIIPELLAEEVWNGLGDIDDGVLFSFFEELDGDKTREEIICEAEWSMLVDLVTLWKADNSENEPEVEWVFDCFQNSNIDYAIAPIVKDTEDEAKKYCEDMAKKYQGEAFAYIQVCRVKQ